MLSEKEKPLCSRQRFIVIFCFQNSQANNADAATIKALPASDNNIGAANGHNSSARKAAKPPSPARIIPMLPQIPYRRLSTNPAAYSANALAVIMLPALGFAFSLLLILPRLVAAAL